MKNLLWKIKITSEQGFGKIIHLPKGEYIFGSDENEAFFVLPDLAPRQFKACIHNLDSFDIYDYITQTDAKIEQIGEPDADLYKVDYDELTFLITKINNEFHYVDDTLESDDVPELNSMDQESEEYDDIDIATSNAFFSPAVIVLFIFITVLGSFIGYSVNIDIQGNNASDDLFADLDDPDDDSDESNLDTEKDDLLANVPDAQAPAPDKTTVAETINSPKQLAQAKIPAEETEDSSDDEDGTDSSDFLAYLKTLITTSGLNNLEVLDEGNQYIIRGYVPTARSFNRLAKTISSEGIAVKYEVTIIEQMITSIKNIIAQYGYNDVKVTPGEKPGHIIFDGYIKNPYNWLEVEKRLKSDVEGIKSWERIKPVMWEDIDKLITELKLVELYDKITINKSGKNLILTGKLNSDEKILVDNIVKKVGLEDSLEVSMSSMPGDYPSLGKILNSHVSSFVIGRKEYFSLGKNKYFVGSTLPNGAKVIQIKKSCVLLYYENDLLCTDPRKS